MVVDVDRLDREIQRMITARTILFQQQKQKKEPDDKKKCCFPWPFSRKHDQSRARSKSRDVGEKKPLVDEGQMEAQAGKCKPHSEKKLMSAEEIVAQKQRAIRVKQLNDEIMTQTRARVHSHQNYNSIVQSVHQTAIRSESVGASTGAGQRKSVMSIVNTNSAGNAGKSVKSSKLGIDLDLIALDIANSNEDDGHEALMRLERSESSATIKAKGSWKQLSRRQEAVAQTQ